MALIDDVCAEDIFREKVGKAVGEQIKRGTNGKEIYNEDGSYNIQVSEVVIVDLEITPDEDSDDDEGLGVSVKGSAEINGIYMDGHADGDPERPADELIQDFEATVRVRLPSNVGTQSPAQVAEDINIEDDDIVTISINDAD